MSIAFQSGTFICQANSTLKRAGCFAAAAAAAAVVVFVVVFMLLFTFSLFEVSASVIPAPRAPANTTRGAKPCPLVAEWTSIPLHCPRYATHHLLPASLASSVTGSLRSASTTSLSRNLCSLFNWATTTAITATPRCCCDIAAGYVTPLWFIHRSRLIKRQGGGRKEGGRKGERGGKAGELLSLPRLK